MNYDPAYGSHLFPLMHCVINTGKTPILELGTGIYSSLMLNAYLPVDRLMLSFETDKGWADQFQSIRRPGHFLFHINNYDEMYGMDCMKHPPATFGLIIVDHAPCERRIVDVERLYNDNSVFIMHDVETPIYGYSRIAPKFRFNFVFNRKNPHTAIFTNNQPVYEAIVKSMANAS